MTRDQARCPVCRHPALSEIEKALLEGESFTSVGNRHGIYDGGISRHVGHAAELGHLLDGAVHFDQLRDPEVGEMPERRQCALLLRSGATSIAKGRTSRLEDVEELGIRSSPLAIVMRWAARLLEEEDRGLARLSVTGIERRILWLLEDVGRLTDEEIAEKLGMPSREITEHARPLVSAGFVRRSGRTLEAT